MKPPVIVTVIRITNTHVIACGASGGTWSIPRKLAAAEELALMRPGTVCELARQKPKTLRALAEGSAESTPTRSKHG